MLLAAAFAFLWPELVRAGTVTGKVKDAATGAALSGVKVMVTQQTSRSGTTNSSGVYTIKSVSAGTKTLTASKTGYLTQVTGSITVPSSGTVTAPDIMLVKLGSITGTVVDADSGAAVSSATVTVTGTSNSTTTTSAGAFTLAQAAGTYTLTVSKTGWVTTTTSSFAVANGQVTDLGTVPLTQTATVTGRVVDISSGGAIANASVKLHSDPSKATTTNSTGT